MSELKWGTPKDVFKKTYEDKHGNHYHQVTMEDGAVGEYVCKPDTDPYFKVGVAVQYESIEQQKTGGGAGSFFKFKKPREENNQSNNNGYRGGGGGRDKVGTGMMVGNAINNAVLLMCHGKITEDQVEAMADRICEISIRIKEKYDGQG